MPPLRSQAEFFMVGILPVPGEPDTECSTCLGLLTDDVVKMIKCGHMFHCTCILPWFQGTSQRRGACPNCRTELFEPEPLSVPYVQTLSDMILGLGGAERNGQVQSPRQGFPEQSDQRSRQLQQMRQMEDRLIAEYERRTFQGARRQQAWPASPRDNPGVRPLLPRSPRDVFAPLDTETIESLLRRDLPEGLRRRYEEELILRRAEANPDVSTS